MMPHLHKRAPCAEKADAGVICPVAADAVIEAVEAAEEIFVPHHAGEHFAAIHGIGRGLIEITFQNMIRTQIEGHLLLTGISPQPMRVFRASGIDKLVEIREAVS